MSIKLVILFISISFLTQEINTILENDETQFFFKRKDIPKKVCQNLSLFLFSKMSIPVISTISGLLDSHIYKHNIVYKRFKYFLYVLKYFCNKYGV